MDVLLEEEALGLSTRRGRSVTVIVSASQVGGNSIVYSWVANRANSTVGMGVGVVPLPAGEGRGFSRDWRMFT